MTSQNSSAEISALETIMKPDWSASPSWAKYLAQDPDGEWWWYEERPFWCSLKDRWGVGDGRCISDREFHEDDPFSISQKSLECRP